MFKVIYLYILECNDRTLYVGVTSDLDRRLEEHSSGFKRESYTYSRRPVKLVYHTMFMDFNQAFEWETRIKKWSRAKKLALIAGDFDSLIELSKKKFKNKAKN